jgi:hypothetical protein
VITQTTKERFTFIPFSAGHSNGNFAELISGARANQLDFVIMTEHPQAEFDTSAMTLNGMHAGILFVNGNEVSTASGDRLLLIPGQPNAASMSAQTTQQVSTSREVREGWRLPLIHPSHRTGPRQTSMVWKSITCSPTLGRSIASSRFLMVCGLIADMLI